MFKDIAWNNFIKTGNIETYMEFKRLEDIDNSINEKKGEMTDETYKGEGNSNKGSSI